MTTMTDEQLATAIQEAAAATQTAQAEAHDAASRTGLADLQAEQQRRAQERQAERQNNRADWAEWFLDGGGYNKLKTQLNAEEEEAREAFRTALKESPLGQAAARYYAAVDNRQAAIDLREQAYSILQRPFNAVTLANRTQLVDEAVSEIHQAARSLASEKWDELKAATETNTEHREWSIAGKVPAERTEELTVAGPDEYGKPVRVSHNLLTGETTILDEDFIKWEAARKEAQQEADAEPPYWTVRKTPEEAADRTGEQTRRRPIVRP